MIYLCSVGAAAPTAYAILKRQIASDAHTKGNASALVKSVSAKAELRLSGAR